MAGRKTIIQIFIRTFNVKRPTFRHKRNRTEWYPFALKQRTNQRAIIDLNRKVSRPIRAHEKRAERIRPLWGSGRQRLARVRRASQGDRVEDVKESQQAPSGVLEKPAVSLTGVENPCEQ